MWANIAKFILKNRTFLLLSILIVTIFMSYQASFVEVSYSGMKVLPLNDPDYLTHQNFKKEFGEDGNVMVLGVESSELYSYSFYKDWYELTHEIKDIQGIKEVLSNANLYNLFKNEELKKFELINVVQKMPENQDSLNLLAAQIKNLPFYEGIIYSDNPNVTLMAITFNSKELNSGVRNDIVRQIMSLGEDFEEKHNTRVHISGLPFIRTAIGDKVSFEFQLFLVLSILITAVILFIFFRSFRASLFPVLVVIVGVIWSLGLIVTLGFKITMLSALIPPLVVIIGIPNSVLMLNKYHTEFRKHNDKKRALLMMIQRIGFTTFIANLTTAIGFGVFYFTDSALLKEFGLVTAVMVMATYVIALILIPIVFYYLPAPKGKHTKHLENTLLVKFIEQIINLITYRRKLIYMVAGVIVVAGFIGMNQIKINRFVVDDLPKKDPVFLDLKFFEREFKGVLPFEIVIDTKKESKAKSYGTIRRIDKLQDLLSEYPEFSRPLSINQALKFSNQAFFNGLSSQFRTPKTAELSFITKYAGNSSADGNLMRSLIDSTKQKARVSVQMADVGSAKMDVLMAELSPRVDSIFPKDKYNVEYTGSSLIFLKGNNYLVGNLRESLFLAIGIISIIMLLLFRSYNPKLLMVSLFPNLIPLLITAGIMGYAAINLKPSTILIFSIAFGIASDQTIYFLTRFRQDSKDHKWTLTQTINSSLRETGVSMIYTAIILFFGFIMFSASNFGGTKALGSLISITLLMSLIFNLILLPTLIYSLSNRKNETEEKEIESTGKVAESLISNPLNVKGEKIKDDQIDTSGEATKMR
ncbi:MAG: putative RND superfamily exporter protein [Sphingobacteriales bacterium]|jgi:predicted RND superfamily exporter protein